MNGLSAQEVAKEDAERSRSRGILFLCGMLVVYGVKEACVHKNGR